MTAGPARFEIGVGLGSNIGDKAATIRDATARLQAAGIVEDLVLSSLYRTAPWGHVAQDWFVNACACGSTRMEPAELLARVKALEAEMGRTSTERWGPRVIDIDILYYGDVRMDTPHLTLPHKEILRRAFVLVPLAEIRPNLLIGGVPIGDAIARLGEQDVVRLDEGDAGGIAGGGPPSA